MVLKRVVLIVLVLALIGAAALLVLAARFDPEALGQAVLRRLNAAGVAEVEAERFSLNPLTGLRIDDAAARGELSAGRFTASLESLRLEHEPWSLLRGELVVREVVLRAPVVTVISTPRAPASPSGRPEARRTLPSPAEEPGPTRRIRFAISRIEASDCQLFSRAEGADGSDLEIHGCELELVDVSIDPSAASLAAGAVAAGSIRASRVRLAGIEGRDAVGRLVLGEGRLTFRDLRVRTDVSDLEIEALELDLTRDPPPYRLELSGDVDLDRLLEHDGEAGFGPGRLHFEGLGTSSATGSLVGTGRVRLAAGEIPAAPLPRGIDAIVGRRILARVGYEATEVGFRLAGERIAIEPFELTGQGFTLAGSGELDLAGPLSLRLEIAAPRERIKIEELPRELLDVLEDERGWVRVPLEAGGTFEAPRLAVDRQAVERMAREHGKRALEREAEKLGTRLLRELLGDDEDEGDGG